MRVQPPSEFMRNVIANNLETNDQLSSEHVSNAFEDSRNDPGDHVCVLRFGAETDCTMCWGSLVGIPLGLLTAVYA